MNVFNPKREMLPIEDMLDGFGEPGDILERMGFAPNDDGFAINDAAAIEFYRMFQRGGAGREIIEWLFDLTTRHPVTSAPPTLEGQAMAHVRCETRYGIGHVLIEALKRGRQLVDQEKQG